MRVGQGKDNELVVRIASNQQLQKSVQQAEPVTKGRGQRIVNVIVVLLVASLGKKPPLNLQENVLIN